jgi:pSer/pThr/pTyr-binding forkhead associated (FHA) protein
VTEGSAPPALVDVGAPELKLMQLGDRWILVPCSGVTVNGRPVSGSTIVEPGDKIEVLGLVLSVAPGAGAPPAPAAPPAPPPATEPHPTPPPPPTAAAPASKNERHDPVKLADVASMVRKGGVESVGLKFPILLSGGDRPLGENVQALVYPIGSMRGRSRDKQPGETERLSIGRGRENEITVEDDMVSKRHAALVLRDGSWSLVDDGSSNGTFVDGQKLERGRPIAVAGPLSTLRFGPKARLVLMDEPSFRAFLRSILGDAVERKRFDTTRVKRAPPRRDIDRTGRIALPGVVLPIPVAGVSEIMSKVEAAPHDAHTYIITLEDAIVEEFESWAELEAFVEGSSRRIEKIEAKWEGGSSVVYLRS